MLNNMDPIKKLCYYIVSFRISLLIKNLLWRGTYIYKGESNNSQQGYHLGEQTIFTFAWLLTAL